MKINFKNLFNIFSLLFLLSARSLEKAECRSKESRPGLLVGSKKDLLSSSNCCLISCRSSSPDLPRNLSLNFGHVHIEDLNSYSVQCIGHVIINNSPLN